MSSSMSMRSLILATIVAALAGCGDGGTAPGAPLPGPFDNGNTGALGSGGVDRGGGGDRGGGTSSAIGGGGGGGATEVDATPATCVKNSDCGTGAYCNRRDSAPLGYCITTCELPGTTTSGLSDKCASGYQCVRPTPGSLPVCLLPCDSPAACSALPPLSTLCIAAVQAVPQNFCIWSYPQGS
jgi:hypothetical protein